MKKKQRYISFGCFVADPSEGLKVKPTKEKEFYSPNTDSEMFKETQNLDSERRDQQLVTPRHSQSLFR